MGRQEMDDNLPVIEISADDAVFWMDERGRWCNAHGPFENPRIIDRFNRALRRDTRGYFVTQERDGIREKVYFHYVDTPLTAMDILGTPPQTILLNSRKRLALDPSALSIVNDTVFMQSNDERIRFSERAMIRLAPFLKETAKGLTVTVGDQCHPITESS
jgi:hypothetical protein